MRVICLGNRSAIKYANHPQPPEGLPLDKLEVWATHVCDIDISGVPQVGDTITDSEGKPQYTVQSAHREALLRDAIARPYRAAVLTGMKLCTTIKVSDESDLLQAVTECTGVWRGNNSGGLPHADGAPAWIAGTWPALVTLLQDVLKIPEARAYDPTLDPN
jgi:hypothetical protein